MRAFSSLLVLAALALLSCATSVGAQGWLADRERTEGSGLRLGDFELHPGIGAEAGYDSNVFLSEEPEDSAVMRLSPHLYISTITGERAENAPPRVLTLRAGISGSVKHYFATDAGTNIGATQDAKLTWRPSSVFALELFEEVSRTIEPFTEPADAGIPEPAAPDAEGTSLGDLSFARDELKVGARAQASTPGDVFKAGLGYKFAIDHFEHDAFRDNRSNSHTIGGDTSWEFYPKTALFWDGGVTLHNFIYSMDELTPAEQSAVISERHDSTSVKTRLGLNGAVTQQIAFTLAGGYGAGFYADNNDYESFIAQVEGRWRPRETILWSLGYDREFVPTFQGNFARMDRFKTRLQFLFGGSFLLSARAEVTLLDFGQDPEQGERDDTHLLGNLSGEYRILDWLAITAELSYWQNLTDFVFVAGSGAAAVSDPAEYKRVEAWLGIRAFL
jgi:hypothetical protein